MTQNAEVRGAAMSATLRGADIVVRALLRAGTRSVFSLSGNQIMPLYDAAVETEINILHVRHEGAAVHMADAWGRLHAGPGVALESVVLPKSRLSQFTLLSRNDAIEP